MNSRLHWNTASGLCLAALLLAAGSAVAQEPSAWYPRVALGWQTATDIHLGDRNCASVSPPALFGCVAGNDGRTLGAYGDFGASWTLGVGVGYHLAPAWRLELNYDYAGNHAFSGQANFLSVRGPEPVSGSLDTHTLLLRVVRDIDFGWERVTPWIGLGAGWVRHRMGSATYEFPGLSPGALTLMPGGDRDDLAWRLDLGVAIRLDRRLTLDVGWYYADLGWMRTDAGPAAIVRARGARVLEIDGIHAPVRVQGAQLGLRYAF